jgi:hypothetical protein
MVAQVGYSVAGRSRGRVTLCAVCTWHVETRSARFLVEPQNKGRRFMSGLASKPVSTIFSSMASKPAVGFLVEPQNQGGGGFFSLGLKTSSYWFGDLGLKITATVSWFGPQNQADFGLSVAPQNRRREVNVGHTSRSCSSLSMEVSLARVFQSGLKTGGGATTGGARGTIVEVASEAS